jgi:hypothetical protein
MRHCASALVVLALVLALAGAALSARLLTTTETNAAAHRHGAAGFVRSSFGSLRVSDVRTLPGLTSKSLGGVTHFPSYVPPTSMQVQVSVVLTNTLARPVEYTPEQFRLWAGPRRSARAAGASTPATTLQPRASLEVRLDFVAPRGGPRLWLEFSDPAQTRATLIDLGRARERTVKKVDAHVH